MKKGGSHSISRIRTFDGDVATLRGTKPPEPVTKHEEVQISSEVTSKKATMQSIADGIMETSIPEATNFLDTQILTPPTPLKKKEVQTVVPIPPPVELHKEKQKKKMPDLSDEIHEITGNQKQSILSSEDIVYDASNNDLDEGTLITSKKKHRFNLFTAIGKSMQSWFGDTTTKITEQKKPKYTVTKAESRIAVITEAARASKHAPQSDHGVVIKRLTKTRRKKVAEGLAIKDKKEIEDAQWATVQETDIPQEVTEEIEVEEMPEPFAVSVEEGIEPVEEIEILEEESPQPVEVLEMGAPTEKPVQKAVPQRERTYRATPDAVSSTPIYIYIIIIIGASLLGIGTAVYWFTSATSVETVIVRIPSLFTAEQTIPVALSTNRSTMLSTILDASLTTRETVQVYPTIADTEGSTQPADAQTILDTLQLRAPGSFTRSVTFMTFGNYSGTNAFILMKVTNFDTAFGGLLDWELDMSEDLSPLFGIPVAQSYDSYARTDTQIRSAFFKDSIVANKSVRILVDAQDNERIIYGFVNPNLILIAPNSETFNAIFPLITQ